MLSPDRPMRGTGDAAAIDKMVDRGRVADLASEAVRIKSYSGDEAEIATCMADRMSALGLEVRLQQVAARRFNAIGIWRGRRDAPSFLYNGHMDTNPAGEGWTRDPLGGEAPHRLDLLGAGRGGQVGGLWHGAGESGGGGAELCFPKGGQSTESL